MISVIIPCFNYGHLIEDTINSVLQQTYKDLEVIVINDGSTDNTAQVVDKIAQRDKRLQCYTFKNSGLGASRNRGLEKANGEFIQFLDADDILEARKFEIQAGLFFVNPAVDVVYGNVRYFNNDPYNAAERVKTYWGPNVEWMPKYQGNGLSFLTKALKGNFAHLSSALFKRTLIARVGQFDNEISAVADYHFLLRCLIADGVFMFHDHESTYSLVRWHPDNMSKNPNFMRAEEIKMRDKLVPLLSGHEEALITNRNAIKGLTLMVNKSWKQVFLSGGPFDFVKKWLRIIGLEKLLQRFFYR